MKIGSYTAWFALIVCCRWCWSPSVSVAVDGVLNAKGEKSTVEGMLLVLHGAASIGKDYVRKRA